MKQPNKKYVGQYTVESDGITHTFDVNTSKRKTVTLRVRSDGRVTVDAPTGTAMKVIHEFVASKTRWIARHREKVDARAASQPERQYTDGEVWHYLGRAYTLRVGINEDEENVTLTGGDLVVRVKDAARVPAVLRAWYLDHARKIFNERMDYLSPAVEAIGIKPPESVTVREMVSKWGSCSSSGRITLNLKLVQLSSDLIDYVIAHELCHLRELNHSANYYALLEAVVPDWKEKRRTLHSINVTF